MDFTPDWLRGLVLGKIAAVPKPLVEAMYRHLGGPLQLLQLLQRQLLDAADSASSPLGLAAAAALLVLALLALNLARRMATWAVGLVLRAAFWSVVVGLLAVVVSGGPAAGLRVVFEAVSWVVGVADMWLREYRRFDDQQRVASGVSRSGHR